MNPRQRRGILLMIVAGIGAVAVTFSVMSYVAKLNAELGSYQTVLRLTQDVPAYQPVTADMVEEAKVPAKFFEESFVSDLQSDLELKPGEVPVSAAALDKGLLLQTSMLRPAPDLKAGEREIAIMVDAETGVAGKVGPGSRVDIYATFKGDQENPPCAVRALTDIEVLELGVVRSEAEEETGTLTGNVPVTFRLNPEDTLRLTYLESFSSTLRLGLVSGEGSGNPGNETMCSADIAEVIGASGKKSDGDDEQQNDQS
ncbi:Flp pilus assembly protein CpaB [Nocardiopsis rhodophaea]|uniref:Flp pilus assembly protein CpaB n=1 Tax=Nocardiopsis rhodophaea TaxID=280238 RepID=UPI0031D94723